MKIEKVAEQIKNKYEKEPWFINVTLVNTHFGLAIQVNYKWHLFPRIDKLDTFNGYHIHYNQISY
jgi:hypothetical protein